MATTSILELYEQRVERLKFGKEIHLNVKARPLTDFRIVFSNPKCHTNRDGMAFATGSLELFVDEMYHQLSSSGYVIVPCEGPFTRDCAYIYLNEKDKEKEFPRLKVYVHPMELAGWAPQTHAKKLLKIAKENSQISNIRLVYSRKVYNMSDEEYLNILRESEPQIRDWLVEYRKHCRRKMGNTGDIFNEAFGIKRLSVKHLSFHDYVAINFVNGLW